MKYIVIFRWIIGCFLLLHAGNANAQYNYNKNNVYKPPVKSAEDERRYQENAKKADKKREDAEAEKARDYLMKLPERMAKISERLVLPDETKIFKWVEPALAR